MIIVLRGGKDHNNYTQKAWRPIFAMMFASYDTESRQKTDANNIRQIIGQLFAEEQSTYWPKDNNTGRPKVLDKASHNEEIYGEVNGKADDEACYLLGYSPVAGNDTTPDFLPRIPDLLWEYMVLWSLAGFSEDQQKHDKEYPRTQLLITHAAWINPDALAGFLIQLNEDFDDNSVTQQIIAGPWSKSNFSMTDVANYGLSGLLSIILEGVSDTDKTSWKDGNLSLLLVAQQGYDKCVVLLLKAGADVNIVYKGFSVTPQSAAKLMGHHHIAQLLKTITRIRHFVGAYLIS
ncbi:MAG: hypothetical protein AAF352_01130 [Pseudomonadota bacterium]